MCRLTVIVCTHNPQSQFLTRALRGLQAQTLDPQSWELLLVDNASQPPLANLYDVSWHPRRKQLQVAVLGKTRALAEAIRVASAPILVVVDDDNVLAPDYLMNVASIFDDFPFVGVAGGVIRGEFEVPPPPWSKAYLPRLAIVDHGNRVLYARTPDIFLVPPGAGMAIRKSIAQSYLRQIKDDPTRQSLDPVGTRLSRSGDTDMALSAYDLGFAKGYFPELDVTHLIPRERLSLNYLEDLVENAARCDTLLLLIRGLIPPRAAHRTGSRLLSAAKRLVRLFVAGSEQRRIERAAERGAAQGYLDFERFQRFGS